MRILFLIIFTLIGNLSFSQKNSDVWIEGRGKLGFLLAHRSIMGHLAKEHAYAGEVSYLIQTKGNKSWHEAYKFPHLGVTGFFGSVGNDDVLGHFFGAYGFVNIPFIKTKRYSFSGKLGAGLAYSTRFYKKNYPEDPNTIFNVAMSTPLTAQIVLGLESRITLGSHSINVNLDMTHFSNGAFKVPNLGINIPYVSIGYGHRIKKSADTTYHHEDYKKHWEYGLLGFISAKEIEPIGGAKYPVYGFSVIGRRYFREKVGMEVSFDYMHKQSIMGHQSDVPKTQADIIQLGFFTGYLLPMNKFHFLLGMGVYVRDKFSPQDFLYHRLGMRYVFKSGININVTLKSHWARADYVEWGLGYTFRK